MSTYVQYAVTVLRFALVLLRTGGQRKHVFRWLRSLGRGYLIDKPCPWITFDATDVLRASVSPGIRVFEYGSGGSTLFWVTFDPSLVVSIEHDAGWFSEVSQKLGDSSPVDYRLVQPARHHEEPDSSDPADPDGYVSGDPSLARCSFREYVSQIDAFPDGYFDVVMIDGRARASCIKHGARKVRVGGVLVLDNSDRAYYSARTSRYLLGFERRDYPGAIPRSPMLSITSVFTRVHSALPGGRDEGG